MSSRLGLPAGRALAVDVALASAGVAALVATVSGWLGPVDVVGARWWVLPSFLVCQVALLWRRRHPLAVIVAVSLPIVLQAVVTGHASEGLHLALPLAVSLYSVGAYGEPRRAGVGLGIAAAAVVVHDVLDPEIFANGADEWAWGFWSIIQLLAWTAGLFVGARRRARYERERADAAAVALADQRARIARELHDVVTHNVNVVVVQAMAAAGVIDTDPSRAKAPLSAIEQSGREALVEMRRLLGVLRDDNEAPSRAPQPGLHRLAALVDSVRASGLPIALATEGDERAVPAATSLAAYRVVQESLTNVLKHAPGSSTRVVVRYLPGAVEVEVVDNGSRVQSPPVDSGGHGITGIRERVQLFGGEISVGPRPEGGWRVAARFPLVSETG